MKPYRLLLSLLFILPLPIRSIGQDKTFVSFYDKINNYDLSVVFNPDSITDDANQNYKRYDPLGFIDTNYQRFYIHFTSVKKSESNPYEYILTGKTMVNNNVCDFIGTITVTSATYTDSSLMRDIGFPKYKQGIIIAEVKINEKKSQTGSGTITGKLTTDVYFDENEKIHYNALMLIADGFSNNSFEGNWRSYKTGRIKRCNWGDFRIPDCGDLDFGTGEFSVNPKYRKYGWEDYSYKRWEENWWKKSE